MNIVRFGLMFAALVWSAFAWAQVPNGQAGIVHASGFSEEPWGGTLYDDFNHKWLDPAKWQVGNPQCWVTLECVREIKDGQLRLAVRDFGATNSDSGIAWSGPEVRSIDPNVMSVKADITPRSFSGVGCTTNNKSNDEVWGSIKYATRT